MKAMRKVIQMPTGNALCPDCQRMAKLKTWYDGMGWLVEVDVQCECGYHYSLAYGKETIEHGKEGDGE